MITQQMIDGHAARVAETCSRLQSDLVPIVGAVASATIANFLSEASIRKGLMIQTPENAKRVLEIETTFKNILEESEYYQTILTFVSSFIDQVDEVERMLVESDVELRKVQFSSEDKDLLADQAAAAISVFDTIPLKAFLDLRQLLARSIGESDVATLVKGVSDIILRVANVEQTANDQLILFFRFISGLVYRKMEASGTRLLYKYVGRGGPRSRSFCKLLLTGSLRTMSEIDSLSNGQVGSALNNCGGFGCKHFWAIAGVAK